MKITIIGAGTIGANLAKHLSGENHEVYLVEIDKEVALKAHEKLDVKVIIGSGSDPNILKEAMIKEAGLVIAVTPSDETNLVVCSLAAAMGTGKKIARVRSEELNKVIQEFGHSHFNIDEIINPEQITSESIVKIIKTPGSSEVADFANGNILLRSFDISPDSPLCGIKLNDQKLKEFSSRFLIVAMRNNGTLIFPRGDTQILDGYRIYVLLTSSFHDEFLDFVNPNMQKPKKVIIYGATTTGKHLAISLSKFIKEVIVLEEDMELAKKIANEVESIRVINGSGSETEMLKECGIEASDAFIAVSTSDHLNLISAVLAKKMGTKTTIITTHQPDYLEIISAMGIDVVINPHILATYQILRLLRGSGTRHIAKLMGSHTEVLELIPEKDSPITNAPIRDINFPKNSIVGAITRNSEIILVGGNVQIQAGEPVIVFCHEEAVQKLQKIFTKKKFF
ncbi:MAG: Trk system potassium transporter TrkA [Candidatus Aureabacteria bacterium]|nr:Trk system potassium transporter TrkA [Candidatus Auribacterota bacterium]